MQSRTDGFEGERKKLQCVQPLNLRHSVIRVNLQHLAVAKCFIQFQWTGLLDGPMVRCVKYTAT